MSIQTLLRTLPAKPGVALAIVTIAFVTGYYYYERQAACDAHDTLRETLYRRAAASLDGGRFAVRDITPFEWTDIVILTDTQVDGREPECPFGSDWLDERRRLLAARRLEVMVFFDKGRSRRGFRYIEYDKDRITFVGAEKRDLSPDSAVFSVSGQPDALTLAPLSVTD